MSLSTPEANREGQWWSESILDLPWAVSILEDSLSRDPMESSCFSRAGKDSSWESNFASVTCSEIVRLHEIVRLCCD